MHIHQSRQLPLEHAYNELLPDLLTLDSRVVVRFRAAALRSCSMLF